MNSRLKDLLLYLIPLAASSLFFVHLGDHSFSFDELVTTRALIHPDLLFEFFRDNLHPPLYFFLLRAVFVVNPYFEWVNRSWLSLLYIFTRFFPAPLDFAGFFSAYVKFNVFSLFSSYNEFSSRLFSAICMLLANFGVFHFLKKRGFVWAGAGAVLLMGVNAKLIYYAQDARPYALLTLLTVLTLAEFFAFWNKKITRKLLFLNVLLLLTHFYAVFLVIAQLLALGFSHRKNFKIKMLAGAGLVLPLALLPWFYSLANLRRFGFLHGFGWSELLLTLRQVAAPSPLDFFYCAALLFLAVRLFRGRPRAQDQLAVPALVFLNLNILVLALVCLIRPVFGERYVSHLIPLQAVLLVCAFQGFLADLTSRRGLRQGVFAFIMLAGVLIPFRPYSNLQKDKPIEPAYRAIAADGASPFYFLEEVSPRYFEYYTDKYGLKLIHALIPKSEEERKKQVLEEGLNKAGRPGVFYFIQVWHPDLTPQPANIVPEGYLRHLLWTDFPVRVFKFTKIN